MSTLAAITDKDRFPLPFRRHCFIIENWRLRHRSAVMPAVGVGMLVSDHVAAKGSADAGGQRHRASPSPLGLAPVADQAAEDRALLPAYPQAEDDSAIRASMRPLNVADPAAPTEVPITRIIVQCRSHPRLVTMGLVIVKPELVPTKRLARTLSAVALPISISLPGGTAGRCFAARAEPA